MISLYESMVPGRDREINKLAMIHQEQGDIIARYSKPPSTNITKIDTPDHNCQVNTASNCELKSYPNTNTSNSKANEFKMNISQM